MFNKLKNKLSIRIGIALLSHIIYLAFAWRHRDSIGIIAAICACIPAIVTSYLFGLLPGVVGAFVLAFVENPLLYSWSGYGFFESFTMPANILGSVGLIAISVVIGHLHDLRIRLRHALQKQIESQQALERKNRELIDFTSIITHDLRNPLSGIKSAFQILKTSEIIDGIAELQEILEAGSETVEYMQMLIDELLDISRLDSGIKKLDLKPVNLRGVVENVISRFKLQPQCSRISFELSADASVIADEEALTKIFMNLIGNSVTYMGKQTSPRISIGASQSEAANIIKIFVSDNGIGIPEANLDKVFERFTRGDNVKTLIKGTGLGLYIVKGLVEAHGGKVWLNSKEGDGTTVYFTLSAPVKL